jgi:hypothetical protein
MNEDIILLCQRLLANSIFRGIDPLNPPVFVIQPDEQVATTWNIIVSKTEPTFSRTPYNALWIPADNTDVNYGKLMLRVDHETTSFTYRSQWVEATDSATAFATEQYYRAVVEDLSLYGITDPNTNVPNASTTVLGVVRLAANTDGSTVLPTGIDPDDVRMSDDRYPLDHTHPDYARTMIKINATQYALVSRSSAPAPGMSLFLEAVHPDNPDVYIAKWRFPTEADYGLDYSVTGIVIEGPTTVTEQSTTPYLVKASFAGGQEVYVTPTTFTIDVTAPAATLDPLTGELIVGNLDTNITITMTATFTFRGVTVTDTHVVTATAFATLIGLTIIGPDTVAAGSTTPYTFLTEFADETTAFVTPDSFTTSNTSVSSTQEQNLVATTIYLDAFTNLNASYTFDGVTVSATVKPVLIEAAEILPASMEIVGPNSITEGTTSIPYIFRVTFNNGAIVDVVPATFVSNKPALTVIDTDDYTINVPSKSILADTTALLSASYTDGGVTVTATKNLSVINVVEPDFLRITGGDYTSQVDPIVVQLSSLTDRVITENTFATLVMDDESTVPGDINNVVWSITGPDAAAVELTVFPTGSTTSRYIQIRALNDVTGLLEFTLTAVMTYEGIEYTVSRPTQVQNYVEPPVVPTQMRIRVEGGPDANTSQHDEDTTIQMYYEVQLSNNPGVWVDVTAEPELVASIVEPDYGAVLAPGNVDLILPEVTGNKNITIAGSYEMNGTTVEAQYVVVIVDTTVYPMELRIRKVTDPTAATNSSSEDEGQTIDFIYSVRYTDAPSTWVDVTANPLLDANLVSGPAGSVLSPDFVSLTLPEVTGNQTAQLAATFTENGVTVNATYTVTIVDTTVYLVAFRARRSTQPNASTNVATVDENSTTTMVYQAQYSNSPSWVDVTSDVTITEEILTPSYGVTVSNRVVTVPAVDQNRQVTLSATYTYNGTTLTGTFVFNVTNIAIVPLELRLRTEAAPTAANNFGTFMEQTDVPMVVVARFSDAPGSWIDVSEHPGLTLSFSNPQGATINDLLVTLPDVTENISITLQASLQQEGTTVNDTYRFDVEAEPDTEVISPRWGKAPQQQWLADYSTPQFYNQLTNPLTGIDGEVISFTGTVTGYEEMWFLLLPKDWEYPLTTEVSTGFLGGWDGGGHTVNDGAFIPNAEAIINGNEYWVYRITFPLGVGNFAYSIRWNTADPRSGFE